VHPDHLGTPRVATRSVAVGGAATGPNAVNKAVWRWDSDPFGTSLDNSKPNENPQQVTGTQTQIQAASFKVNNRFPGQVFDAESSKSYNYFRDYDPSIGRYTESDPIGLTGGLSTFTYVRADPLGRSDSSGLLLDGKPGGGGGEDGASGACKLIAQIPMHTSAVATVLGIKWWCIYLCKTAECPPKVSIHQRASVWKWGCPDFLPLQQTVSLPN
jgi:RHS repeat-associated protein